MLCWSLDQLLESEVKDLPITMMPDGWMEKTGGYAKDMTLRDAIAIAAMQGLLASEVNANMHEFARRAYQIADIMLEVGQ